MTPPLPPRATDPLGDLLDRALRSVTPEVDPHATLDAITARRRARQARVRRRRAAAAVVVTGVAACLLALVVLDRAGVDRVESVELADERSTVVTTTSVDTTAGSDTTARSDTGERSSPADGVVLKGQLGPTREVPGDGERIISLTSGPDGWWIGRGDPLDADDPVVSTLTRIGPDGTLGATAEIHGVPLMAVADGARLWVLSEDRVRNSTDDTRYRLKEIDAASGAVRSSVALSEGSTALGIRSDGDGVHVLHADATSVLDRATGSVQVLPGEPGSTPSTSQVLFTDATRWIGRVDRGEAAAIWNDLPTSASPAEVPGMHRLVAADAWAEGAAAAAVDTEVGVDLVELDPPPRSAPEDPPATRTRLNGLPAGTELLAVGADRVWLLVDTSVVAMALD